MTAEKDARRRRTWLIARFWTRDTAVAGALMCATAAGAQQPALTLTATAVGCHWRYAYAGIGAPVTFDPGRTRCHSAYCPLGLDPDRAAAVPVGVPVRLVATSADKVRVLAVPPLGLQIDAVPGKTSEATLQIAAEGLYPARQGADCADDPAAIGPAFRALDRPGFDDWLNQTRKR